MTQFKVGDWVRHPSYGIGKVLTYRTRGPFHTVEVKGSSLWGTRSTKDGTFDRWIPLTYIELWQPKEGEWCVFTQSSDDSAIIAQYDKTIKIDHTWDIPHTEVLYKSKESAGLFRYRKIEPFIGQLPSWIKDN